MKKQSIKNFKKNSNNPKGSIPKLVLELYQYENGLRIIMKTNNGEIGSFETMKNK